MMEMTRSGGGDIFINGVHCGKISDITFQNIKATVTAEEFRSISGPKIERKAFHLWNGVELSKLPPEDKKSALAWLEAGLACGAIHEPNLDIAEIRQMLSVDDEFDEFDLAARYAELLAYGVMYEDPGDVRAKISKYLRARFVPKDGV